MRCGSQAGGAAMTQRERVLAILRAAGPRGVCLADVPGDLSYVLRNRVGDCSKLGYTITSQRCRFHRHRGLVSRYRLLEGATDSGPTGTAAVSAPTPASLPAGPSTLFDEPYRRSGAAL